MTENHSPLKISMITPNYNGAKFLEKTIQSVLSQEYPNLEYILVDGASTDNSMEIVNRYSNHFAKIISEKDQGHAHALNKGFRLSSGDILCWVNSDDFLLPGALQRVNRVFSTFPEVKWLTGRPTTADEQGTLDPRRPIRKWSWLRFVCGDFRHIQQESTFWHRTLWDASGGHLNTRYRLANDFELWLRFFLNAPLYTIDATLGCFRSRSGQRSISQAADYERECEEAFEAFIASIPAALLSRFFHTMPENQLRSRRIRPDLLPGEVRAVDPPLIFSNPATGRLLMEPSSTDPCIPLAFQPNQKTREDLVFDGLDRAAWSNGPNFVEHDLRALEMELTPFAPDIFLPQEPNGAPFVTVALVGPLVLTDLGRGKMRLQIHFRDGVRGHDLPIGEAGRNHRIKLLLDADRYALFLDGRTLAVESTKGPQVMQAPFVVLGGGNARCFWVGAVGHVSVTTAPRLSKGRTVSSSTHTHQLLHADGELRLERHPRTKPAYVKSTATRYREHASSLTAFRNRHLGHRCFVMGNGPSLNKMDLEKLAGEFVFACNASFLLFDRISWRPTYHTCVDTRVLRDRARDIRFMLDEHPAITAFFPAVIRLHDGSRAEFRGRDIIPPGPNRYYFNEVGNRESHHVETMFSLDADDYVVQPYTVAVTMLQLAFFMGFSEIYLIGCDTNYKVQESVRQEGHKIDGVGLMLTSTCDDDCNHFDPRYFGKGREWHNPQVNKMIDHYRWAQLAVRRTGTRIFNATVGGRLEVFPRVSFDSLFPPSSLHRARATEPLKRKRPLLSIAIPAYNRPGPLLHALERFTEQIEGKYEEDIEIIISDDCSPDDSLESVREWVSRYPFIHYRRYETNIGLERNLTTCADMCGGEYLWIFGDDDYLETGDALDKILTFLRKGCHDVLVLNRTRRSADLSVLVSPNWMNLDPALQKEYSGLREFCLEFGFMSVIGFISVNIFRRRLFQRMETEKYMGTMYPQLGAMFRAFHNRPVLLLGEPIVCHRTQTAEEKRRELGQKASESDFMSDMHIRNATYFSHPLVAMMDDLVSHGAFRVEDISRIPENTVIDGLLIDFLVDCVCLNDRLSSKLKRKAGSEDWANTARFFKALPLTSVQRERIAPVLSRHGADVSISGDQKDKKLTVSVITTSLNQAEFLPDCLRSIRDQTYPPLEHLVFDPGSTDESRAVASSFAHVTLVTEPDSGQSDALNKGFARARGDIICWLNSDDQLADQNVLARIVERFLQDDAPDIVYGKGIYIDEKGSKLRDAYINDKPDSLPWRLAQECGIMQPALFMRRSVFERVGPLREDLHFSMDYEYWIRCVKAGIRFAFSDATFALARYHLGNKTYGQRGKSYREVCRMTKEHFGYVHPMWLKRYAEFEVEGHDGVLAHGKNSGIASKDRLERRYRELLVEYNGDSKTQELLKDRRNDPGYGEIWREMIHSGSEKVDKPSNQIPGSPSNLFTSSPPQDGFSFHEIVFSGHVIREKDSYTLFPPADNNWLAFVHNGTTQPDDRILGKIDLTLHDDGVLHIMLCCHGSADFESSEKKPTLKRGRHELLIAHKFKRVHHGIRIQIGSSQDKISISDISIEIMRIRF